MGISSSAVLVKLNISTWTARRIDKARTSDVLVANNATAKAGQFNKNLMAGTKASADILDYAAQCRNRHLQLTLPWEERGNRVLATGLFLEYKQEFNDRKKTFELLVDDFCTNYGGHIQVAKNYLGGLYDPADYPDESEIRDKFGFGLVFSPVPDAGHFYVDVPMQELEGMKQSLEEENQSRLHDAMRSAWDRMYTTLTHMSDKLTEAGEDTKKRWYDSFLSNPEELCGLLTHLNVTGDPDLEHARRQLEQALSGVSIQDIKESPLVRESMKGKVDAIIKSYEW